MSDLFVHEHGNLSGPAVLAVHGVSAHGRRFVPMAATAFPNARVIAPDLRGHGRSPAGTPATIERHVADLLAILNERHVESAVVVGHSFGACLGLNLLASAPDRVRSVVLLDPAMDQLPEFVSALSDGMIASDIAYPTFDALVEAKRAGRAPTAVPHSDADVALAAAHGPEGWRTAWDHDVVRQAWIEMSRPMPQLAVARPTLLLDATQAGFVTERQRADLAKELGPDLTVEQFDVGHMLFWEDFDGVCASVRSFLLGHTPDVVRP